ncbi:hypothetical protein HJG60_008181 [Phyllostomus discolor]|uniref:Uncharacterized protein n=1 Tax=Phyllostomus discolor TaxID=89673 RepID=A0A833Z6J6_9CHIR|nr:hypothetical protein HJG60_008181 [Phyllostomus discolor]
MGAAKTIGTASGASPTGRLSAQKLLWEAGPAQDAWTSRGLSLSSPICTMVQNRSVLPALALGSKHSLRSGNSSHLGTLSDLCPCDPGLPLSLDCVSLPLRAPLTMPVLQNSCQAPLAETALLPVQEVSASGDTELGLCRNSSISGESLALLG